MAITNLRDLVIGAVPIALMREGGEQIVHARPLTMAEIARIKFGFTQPEVPQDATPADRARIREEFELKVSGAMCALSVGLEALGVDNLDDGARAACEVFLKEEFDRVLQVAIGRGLSNADVEAAKQRLAPLGG